MMETELDGLESQVDSLIRSFQQLTTDNDLLRKKVAELNNRCSILLDKKRKAATVIKKTLKQLQDEMLCQTQKR